MSKQLALSAAFSIFMMAAYVLFGADAVRQPFGIAPPAAALLTSPMDVSVSTLGGTDRLLPSFR